ncbi:hypothetical protein Q2941_45375 [Bradyrhizobium sp. UFLA05-153]
MPDVSRRAGLAGAFCACIAATLLPAAPSLAHAGEATPTDMLTGIYREAVKGEYPDWLKPQQRTKFLSKSLLALWARCDARKAPDDDTGPIDFDPTTDTNGLELESFTITRQNATANAAVLAVKLNYRKPYYRPGPPAVVTYDFVQEDGHWRIDNFHTTKWSIREMLTQWLKKQ